MANKADILQKAKSLISKSQSIKPKPQPVKSKTLANDFDFDDSTTTASTTCSIGKNAGKFLKKKNTVSSTEKSSVVAGKPNIAVDPIPLFSEDKDEDNYVTVEYETDSLKSSDRLKSINDSPTKNSARKEVRFSTQLSIADEELSVYESVLDTERNTARRSVDFDYFDGQIIQGVDDLIPSIIRPEKTQTNEDEILDLYVSSGEENIVLDLDDLLPVSKIKTTSSLSKPKLTRKKNVTENVSIEEDISNEESNSINEVPESTTNNYTSNVEENYEDSETIRSNISSRISNYSQDSFESASYQETQTPQIYENDFEPTLTETKDSRKKSTDESFDYSSSFISETKYSSDISETSTLSKSSSFSEVKPVKRSTHNIDACVQANIQQPIGLDYDLLLEKLRKQQESVPSISISIDKEKLSTLSSLSPHSIALNDLLRSQLQLTTEFIMNSRRIYETISADLQPTYNYTTLEDTKNYIKHQRKAKRRKQQSLKHRSLKVS